MRDGLAIAGIGIHPFGRHDGLTGMQLAAVAARRALADAGLSWADMQFAVGGSDSAGRPDTLVSQLGLTGLPFTNVLNGCATGGAALATARAIIAAGTHEIGLIIGFDKHPRGAFDPRPEDWGLGSWYGELGLMLTTQYFGIKIQRYMHEHGVTTAALAAVAAKAFRNGERNPAAWRRTPLTEDQILASAMVADPLTQYMFCSPSAGAVALVVCRADLAARFPAPPVQVRAVSMRTRRFGSFEVFSPSIPVARGPSPTQEAAQAAYAEAGIGPGEFDVVQVQDTESGAELIHLAECGLCEHGGPGEADADRGDRDRRPDAGQHRRRLHRQRRADRGVGPAPGLRDRAPAARPGGRAPGGRGADRVHARLRRAGHQRLRHPEPVTR
jgi:acetyl-CoA C-acetyltransferase